MTKLTNTKIRRLSCAESNILWIITALDAVVTDTTTSIFEHLN